MKINLSIVLYNSPLEDINNIIKSLELVKTKFTLYVIDNSPTDELEENFKINDNIVYIHNPENPGFGASHNIAIKRSIEEKSKYHFVINPDVFFDEDAITNLVNYMQNHDEIGMIMPKILNINGSTQFLPKLLPSPYSILMRKVKFPSFLYNTFINKYELRKVDENLIYEAPVLSGCFTLFRTDALREVGLYDERYFMYFEDWDLSRRMHAKFKTVYYPKVCVYHGYDSGANKSKRLFKIYLNSAFSYFTKWGWFFDKERKRINKKTLKQFTFS